ncbi:hypothetical protein POX_g09317 [Penicillium oxalicum]|uniref:hypothetical protein n=1 Tax=Penicillium oxalicum TaxID=69781 RepID=UPI0020B64386|nr:hypothetical protein POX_g09317 [Penicillium oxalicum]KAI2786920.1 hypothetical protein POX_g09317 [Penicillium oxalicum]
MSSSCQLSSSKLGHSSATEERERHVDCVGYASNQLSSTSLSTSKGTLQVTSNLVKIIHEDEELHPPPLGANVLATSITAQLIDCSQCSDMIADLTEDIQLRDQAIRDLRAEIVNLKETMKTLQFGQ